MTNVYTVSMGQFYANHFTTLKEAFKNYRTLIESGNIAVKLIRRECVWVSKSQDTTPTANQLSEALDEFKCVFIGTIQVDLVSTKKGYFLVPHDKEEVGTESFEVVLDSLEEDD